MALKAGYKNGRSAQTRYSQMMKKLKEEMSPAPGVWKETDADKVEDNGVNGVFVERAIRREDGAEEAEVTRPVRRED